MGNLNRKLRNVILQILRTLLSIITLIMVLKGLQVATNCKHPIAVADSTSMEPTIQRGDLLILSNLDPVRVGSIVSFHAKEKGIDVLNRVIRVHKTASGITKILTKGDNNQITDRSLYGSEKWLNEREIIGQARFLLRNVGIVFIYAMEYPVIQMLFTVKAFYVLIRQHIHLFRQIM